MPTIVVLFLAALLTVAATGLGVIPVALLGPRRVLRVQAALAGLAAGAMLVAAVVGLLEPGLEGDGLSGVLAGAAAGVLLIVFVHRRLQARSGSVAEGRWKTVAIALFVHSLPEGMAIGTAFASDRAGLDALVVFAIAMQNIPEGTATALPMQQAGLGTARQTVAALVTSVPQVFGALLAFALVESVDPLLPVSFGFAAGAMVALVVTDIGPDAVVAGHRRQGLAGIVCGGLLMLAAAQLASV